jgi:hypothetical protein
VRFFSVSQRKSHRFPFLIDFSNCVDNFFFPELGTTCFRTLPGFASDLRIL